MQRNACIKQALLRAVCSVAEGTADVIDEDDAAMSTDADQTGLRRAADVCRAALRSRASFSVVGGREGMPRSLGSVYCGSVLRFIGGFNGMFVRNIDVPQTTTFLALSNDGTKLFTTCTYACLGGTPAVRIFRVSDGALLHELGRLTGGHLGPMEFAVPSYLCEAPDGFLYIADVRSGRVAVLTPQYRYHRSHELRMMDRIAGMCVNDDVWVALGTKASSSNVLYIAQREKDTWKQWTWSRAKEALWGKGVSFLPDQRYVAYPAYVFDKARTFVVVRSIHTGEATLRFATDSVHSRSPLCVSACGEFFTVNVKGHLVRFSGDGASTCVVDDTVSTFRRIAMCRSTLAAWFYIANRTYVAIYR